MRLSSARDKRCGREFGMTPLLTPHEVSQILKRPLSSIYELVKNRKIAAVKEGRRIRFRVQDVDAFIEENLVKPFSSLSCSVQDASFNSGELRAGKRR